MLKTTMLTGVLAAALVAGPSFAQAPVQQRPDAPGAHQQTQQQAGGGQQGLASPGPKHMLSSDLQNATVYGTNDENIGSISDVLLDRNGQVVAVIVGVGGFLGLGQKDVAIPFEALQFEGDQGQDSYGTTGAGTTGAPGQQGTMQPDRIVLRGITKVDLEQAPEFRSDRAASGRATGPARAQQPQGAQPAAPGKTQ